MDLGLQHHLDDESPHTRTVREPDRRLRA
jgi:hypothetical protein